MKTDWPLLFKNFFENSSNQERLGVVAMSRSARELWLQGELFYWFRQPQISLPGMGQFWVNVNATYKTLSKNGSKRIRPDVVFRDWDYDKREWKGEIKMVAEIKFLGYSFQPKTIFGGPLKELPENGFIYPETLAGLELKGNSLLRDYSRLLDLNAGLDSKPECYLILVYSEYRDDRKKIDLMTKALQTIEFEKKAEWKIQIGEEASSSLPKPHPFRGVVKLWPIRGKPLR